MNISIEEIQDTNFYLSKYIDMTKDPQKYLEKSGNVNTVNAFVLNDGTKISFRFSTMPIFLYQRNNTYRLNPKAVSPSFRSDYPLLKEEEDEFFEKARLSEENWFLASEQKLSPKLYYYGYCKMGHHIHQLIITEGFDSDLHNYYKEEDGEIRKNSDNEIGPIDQDIAKQLTNLFFKLAKKGRIFGDLKPGNCVINFKNKNKPDVKIIDWDADWCKTYDVQNATDWATIVAILSTIQMANHMLTYCNWNIFEPFFNNHKNKKITFGSKLSLDEMYSSCLVLFCQLMEKYDFAFMSSFYLADRDLHDAEHYKRGASIVNKNYNTRSSSLIPTVNRENHCHNLFQKLYDRCFIIRPRLYTTPRIEYYGGKKRTRKNRIKKRKKRKKRKSRKNL